MCPSQSLLQGSMREHPLFTWFSEIWSQINSSVRKSCSACFLQCLPNFLFHHTDALISSKVINAFSIEIWWNSVFSLFFFFFSGPLLCFTFTFLKLFLLNIKKLHPWLFLPALSWPRFAWNLFQPQFEGSIAYRYAPYPASFWFWMFLTGIGWMAPHS